MAHLIHFPFWLGDFVMALPFAVEYCRQNSGKEIIGVVDPYLAPLLKRAHLPIQVWDIDKAHRSQLFVHLWRSRVKKVVFLTNSAGSYWPYVLARVPERVGFGKGFTCHLLSRALKDQGSELPQGLRNRLLLDNPADSNLSPTPYLLKKLRSDTQKSAHLLLFPGAKYGPSKQWGMQNQQKLCHKALNENFTIGLYGSKDEWEQCEELARSLDHAKVSNYSGLFALDGLADHISHLNRPFCIANDSGALHLVAACGVPTIGLYLSTSPEKTPPAFGRVHIFTADIDCRPCFRRTCPQHHYRCRESISPDMVWDKAKDMLKIYEVSEQEFLSLEV